LTKEQAMQREVLEKVMSEEEYIAYEMASEVRHEYINGKLIEMPGESTANNEIALNIALLLKKHVKEKSWRLFTHDVKLKLPGEKIYFYPDLFITQEESSVTKYVVESALLVAEILSGSTRHFDMFDKYLQYRQIPELRYYLLVEPSKRLITLCEKDDNGGWSTELYDVNDGTITMKYLGLELNIASVFE
jgi:Uma2 family endonuclease